MQVPGVFHALLHKALALALTDVLSLPSVPGKKEDSVLTPDSWRWKTRSSVITPVFPL